MAGEATDPLTCFSALGSSEKIGLAVSNEFDGQPNPAPSATALTAAALRAALEAAVMQAALDDHYVRHPDARPGLGDLAVAGAELDGHPLADEPERIRQAAAEIVERHPDASPDNVVLWAEARTLPAA